VTTCNRPYTGTYGVRTAPCDRPTGHAGFCEFVALSSLPEIALVVGLLLLALGLLADGWEAWGW
jgi:hypothetical protein